MLLCCQCSLCGILDERAIPAIPVRRGVYALIGGMDVKKLLPLLLVMMLLTLPSGSAETPVALGAPLPDFTAKTIDGSSFTLSDALKEHDMVYINLWATWCPYCKEEFPFLEEAYRLYKDRVAIIALSVEKKDKLDLLAQYARYYGLTIPVGNLTETDLDGKFVLTSVPTSVVVDRFGNVAMVKPGVQRTTAAFIDLFEYFIKDSYTETTVLEGFPTNVCLP